MLLALVLATSPPPAPGGLWPDTGAIETRDLDQDGVPDALSTRSEGGSGFSEFVRCARHGASGHVACDETHRSAYTLFSVQRRLLEPALDNRAAALLPADRCSAYDPEAAGQAAMMQLLVPTPRSGVFAPKLRWLPGKPADQVSVCMDPSRAAPFPSWFDSPVDGESDSAAWAAEGWTARYSSAWPQVVSPGESFNFTPRLALDLGGLQIYQHAHALAVYDPTQNRHAWLANFASPTDDGFKLDRWERVAALTAAGPRALDVQIAPEGSTLRIEISP